jgi:hypothetical protein
MTAAESSALPRGERTLQAVVESPGTAPEAWKGTARSTVARVAVVDEPKPLPAPWAERKSEVLVEAAFWRDGAEKALAVAGTLQPNSWKLTSMKAQLLVRAGRGGEALQAMEQAIDEWRRQNPRSEHPPVDLLARRDRLVQSLLRKK